MALTRRSSPATPTRCGSRRQLRLHPRHRLRRSRHNAYIQLLRRDGNLTLVGAPDKPHAVSAFGLRFGNKSLSGSLIGGIRQTQEMLGFCGAHNITAHVERIPIQKVNEAYESDVKYRMSLDELATSSRTRSSDHREPTSCEAGSPPCAWLEDIEGIRSGGSAGESRSWVRG